MAIDRKILSKTKWKTPTIDSTVKRENIGSISFLFLLASLMTKKNWFTVYTELIYYIKKIIDYTIKQYKFKLKLFSVTLYECIQKLKPNRNDVTFNLVLATNTQNVVVWLAAMNAVAK